MFQIFWGKNIKHNKFMVEKVVKIDNKSLNISNKIQAALKTLYHVFNLEKPMWFDKIQKNLIRNQKYLLVKTSFSLFNPFSLII